MTIKTHNYETSYMMVLVMFALPVIVLELLTIKYLAFKIGHGQSKYTDRKFILFALSVTILEICTVEVSMTSTLSFRLG